MGESGGPISGTTHTTRVVSYCFVEDRDENTPRTTIPPSQEFHASFLSRVLFSWIGQLIQLGSRRPLEENDVAELSPGDRAASTEEKFQGEWNREVKNSQREPSLVRALWSVHRHLFFLSVLFKLAHLVFVFSSPLLIRQILRFIENSEEPTGRGYMWVGILVFTASGQMIAQQQNFHLLIRIGMRVRSAAIAAVYRKALVLSNQARQSASTGSITNLMSIDSQKLQDFIAISHLLWATPIQIIVTVTLLFQLLGWPAFVGFLVMVVLIPTQTFFARRMGQFRKQNMQITDTRIKTLGEVLQGMKVIKFYAWEESFTDRITRIRTEELRKLVKIKILRALNLTVLHSSPVLVSLATFLAYSLSGNDLKASIVFPSLAYFNILRMPLTMLPNAINALADSKVSLRRIKNFLLLPELQGKECLSASEGKCVDVPPDVPPDVPVKISNGTFTWDTTLTTPTLRDITLEVHTGQLCMIIGRVGAGKSSILAALLKEMEHLDGSAALTGSIAYVAQTAWIQNASLRDNILFGRPFEQERYQRVLEACSLLQDLDILPGKDMTEIGERGINLSGGQKQRVALARAVYADADIYLLDDPLSAVDAHVGRHIFEKCIAGILGKKTRLLVTHQLQFLTRGDMIVLMEEGRVRECGTYEDLLATGQDFSQLIHDHTTNGNNTTPVCVSTAPQKSSGKDKTGRKGGVHGEERKERVDRDTADKKKLVASEERYVGGVGWRIYLSYLLSMGGKLAALLLLAGFIAVQLCRVAADIWLALWSGDEFGQTNGFYLGIYAGIVGAQALLMLGRGLQFAWGSLRASTSMHARLLQAILHAPISFFDITPTGRIVNRFSRDTDQVDQKLPMSMESYLNLAIFVVSVLVVISIVTPLFALLIIPLCFAYRRVQQYFIKSSREIKRLDSITRSPIFMHFAETLNGLSTIRAFRAQSQFRVTNECKIDGNTRFFFAQNASNRWLGLRLDSLGMCVTVAAALFAVLARDDIDPGLAGVSLTYGLQLTGLLNWSVRMATETETLLTSLERIQHYHGITPEAPRRVKTAQLSPSWPEKGAIEFEDIVMRYREDLEPVLRGISCAIHGRERIGVVGRTGSGKSSLMLCLFRMVEPCGGRVLIDGIDTSTIGLHDLRSCMSIIPQDPVLFSGTLRSNLDPFRRYTDEMIWQALSHAKLDDVVRVLPEQLDAPVVEYGENFSQGQRQLICLARALLRSGKVFVLDEATASIDVRTDALLQETVREALGDATLLIIAHRLNTIIDCDRVMVLDNGNLVEFGPPATLLERADGVFASMVDELGQATAAHLHQLARRNGNN